MERGAWWVTVRGISVLDTTEWLSMHTHTHIHTHTLRNGIKKFFKSHSQSVVASDWNQSKLSMWPSFRMKVSPLSTCWMASPWMLSQIFQQVLDWMFVLCWIGRCNSQETLTQNKATRRESLDSVSWQTSLNWISFHVKGSISGKVLKKLFSCEKALELVPWVLASDFRRDSTNGQWEMDLCFSKELDAVWKEENGRFEGLKVWKPWYLSPLGWMLIFLLWDPSSRALRQPQPSSLVNWDRRQTGQK